MRGLAMALALVGVVACSCAQPRPPGEAAPGSVAPEQATVSATPAEPPAAEPTSAPLPRGPVVTPATAAAHARAQEKMLKGKHLPQIVPAADVFVPPVALSAQVQQLDALAVPPSARPMPGYFVPVADSAKGEPLAHFHQALQALQEGTDPDGKVRVAMYGASGTAADIAVGYVRTYLQARFGDGGPGFIPLMPLSKWYRHNEVVVNASKGWFKEHAQRRKGRLDGHYGLLGASFSATAPKRWGEVTPKKKSFSSDGVAQVELYFLRQPGGGSFEVRIDGGPPQVVSTAADEIGPGYHAMQVEPGRHSVKVQTLDDHEVRVFGVVLERPEPGVVVDVLGIDGTRGRNHLTWNESLWADNLRRRAPDLYTLSYGTNESVDDDLSVPMYAEDLRAQLRRFAQALPEASCLLLGPVDFPIVDKNGEVRVRPLLQQIIAVQKQVAAEEGCGFWDGIAFMGGELSMPTWVHSEPPLARRDHLHYTRWGGARKGMALSDALVHAFDARGMGGAQASVVTP